MKTYNEIKQEIIDTSFKITKAIAKGNIGKAEKLQNRLNELIADAAQIDNRTKTIKLLNKQLEGLNIKPYFGVVDDTFIRKNQ